MGDIYLHNVAWSDFGGPANYLLSSEGPNDSAVGMSVSTIASASAEIEFPKCFITPPLVSGITVNFNITVYCWARESSMSANAGLRCRISSRTAAGVETSRGVVDYGSPTELPNGSSSSADAACSFIFSFGAAPFTLSAGDRLVVRFYAINVGTMASGYAVTIDYDGSSGGTGSPSRLMFAQEMGFANESMEQYAVRFRNDDGSQTAATWAANLNADATIDADVGFRARLATRLITPWTGSAFFPRLQYSRNGGSWTDVTNASAVVRASGAIHCQRNPSRYSYTSQALATANRGYGHTFAAPKSCALRAIRFKLSKTGSPTGTLNVAVYATAWDAGAGKYRPSGAALGTASMAQSAVVAGWQFVGFTLNQDVNLTAGTRYAIAVYAGAAGQDASNYVLLGFLGNATSAPDVHECILTTDGGATWGSAGANLFLELVGPSGAAAGGSVPWDEEATTQQISGGAGTFMAHAYSEAGMPTKLDGTGYALSLQYSDTRIETEYRLRVITADVTNGDTVQLRLVHWRDLGNGYRAEPYFQYTQVPTITVSVPFSGQQITISMAAMGTAALLRNPRVSKAFSASGALSRERQVSLIRPAPASAAADVSAIRRLQRAIAASAAVAVSLTAARVFMIFVAAAVTGIVTAISKHVRRFLAVTGSGSFGIVRHASRTITAPAIGTALASPLRRLVAGIAATAGGVLTLGKRVGRILAATGNGAAALVRDVRLARAASAAGAATVTTIRRLVRMIGAAAPGAVALVREVRRVLSFSGTGSAAISAAKSLLQVAVDVVAAGSAMLSRRVGRVLSTTAAGALTYTRQVGRALAATGAGAAAMARIPRKLMMATASGSALLVRDVGRVLAFFGTGAATLSRIRITEVLISAVAIGAATIRRHVTRSIGFAAGGTASVSRHVRRAFAISGTGVASLARQTRLVRAATAAGTATLATIRLVLVAVAAAATGSVGLIRQIRRTLAAAGSGTASLARRVSLVMAVNAAGAADLVRKVGRTISGAASGAATLSKDIARIIVLSAAASASLPTEKFSAKFALVLDVATTGTASLVRQIGLVIAAAATGRTFMRWLGNRFWKLVTYAVHKDRRDFEIEKREPPIVVAVDRNEITVGKPMSYQVVKDPVAVLPYTFDWGDWLGDGATITNSTWTLPENADVTIEDQDVDVERKKTVVWLGGGTAGNTYRVKNQITASDGRDDARSLMVLVRHR
jgi:hypothetical protein